MNLSYVLERKGINFESVANWRTVLSPGEQQRLAFARLLYHRPKFAILDESTSALDIEKEKKMYHLCQEYNITYISVGHRESMNGYHEFKLELNPNTLGWTLWQKYVNLL